MIKIAAMLGILAVGGGFSLCDLWGQDCVSEAGSSRQLISLADARPVSAPGYGAAKANGGSDLVPAAKTKTVTFNVKGMTCGGCVIGVRKVLTRLRGVSKADVSYEKSSAVVTYDPATVTVQQMVSAIKTLGYTATVISARDSR